VDYLRFCSTAHADQLVGYVHEYVIINRGSWLALMT
jgi:hypothetical protein